MTRKSRIPLEILGVIKTVIAICAKVPDVETTVVSHEDLGSQETNGASTAKFCKYKVTILGA
jgi:hypothetical protein